MQPFRLSSYFTDLDYEDGQHTDIGGSVFQRQTLRLVGIHRGGNRRPKHAGDPLPGRHGLRSTKIVHAEIISDTLESLVFQTPWARYFDKPAIKRMNYSQLVRQDQDDVEILHLSDTTGVSTCTTTFVTLAENTPARWGLRHGVSSTA